MATISDDFSSASNWTLESGAVVISGGNLTITIPDSTGAYLDADFTASTHDLSDSTVYVEMVSLTGTRSSIEWRFLFYETRFSHEVMFDVRQGGTLRTYKRTGGSFTQTSSTTYSSTNHRWMRYREDSGTLYYEVSSDASSWSSIHSESTPITVTAGSVVLELGCASGAGALTAVSTI